MLVLRTSPFLTVLIALAFADPGFGAEIVELSSADAKARNSWIGDRWREIEAGGHRAATIEIEAEDEPVSGVVKRLHHPESGEIEAIKVDLAMGDHGGFSEQFFFKDEKLIFVFRQDSHWRFDPKKEGRTIDFFDEGRFYLTADGGLYRALSKKYQANSEEDLDEIRNDARNASLEVEKKELNEMVERAAKLLDAVTQEAVLSIYIEDE